jgi:mRNA interferase MazF
MPNAPDVGDLVWMDFTQSGREQAGRRPGLVLSPAPFNQRTGLAFVCPITSKIKGYPFEVVLPQGGRIEGAILVDQLKSQDWGERNLEHAGKAPQIIVDQVRAKTAAILGLNPQLVR